MDLTEKSSRQSLIPNFLYTSSSAKTFALEKMLHSIPSASAGFNTNVEAVISKTNGGFVIPSALEPAKKIEMYSPAFYAACTAGGILSCGLTHMAVTPLDLVKCNMQEQFNLSISERSMYPTAYTFDSVFGTDCSTRRVYEEGAKKVALSVASGINSSIFAYGQTSSGKTYTMSGITEYAVADIYDYIEKHQEREFVLKFSALEIYNESVRDLLSADTTPLRLLDDPERGTIVEKLTEETLRDWNHFRELLSVCEAQRQIGETSLNEASSRSHQILRLVIESSTREFLGYDKSSSLTAMVNFIDLAGSERASQTLSAGTRLKEGCHINRSLLTLGTVIRKLSKGRNGHIPYRDSKLTRILQSSLGGNAKMTIICTLSPAHSHVEQSRNTLLFASCAKEVTTNAQVNVVMSDKTLVKHLQKELTRLENELKSSGSRIVPFDSSTLLREKDLQIEKLKKEVSELTLQRDIAQSQVKDLIRVLEDGVVTLKSSRKEKEHGKHSKSDKSGTRRGRAEHGSTSKSKSNKKRKF